MSSPEAEGSTPAPTNRRRSGRASQVTQRLGKSNNSTTKPIYDESDSDEGAKATPDPDAAVESEPEVESDEQDAFESDNEPAAKTNGKGKGKATAKPKSTRAKSTKKAASKGAASKDFLVTEDNNLYNAISDPNTSLEGIVDDWIESYKADAGPAMAELINLVLRSSGCNSTVDEHQAEDENGVVEVLDEINIEFKNASLLAYPLVSKSKPLKKFRSSLQSFLNRLFIQSASAEILYETSFCQVLQSWLTSLSSSKIRSFRHTATVISLGAVSALCKVAVAVNKEFASASRAKEAEEKKGRKDKSRLKDLGKNVEEVHERKTKLEEYLTELFEAVFVHRYRDFESIIRAECIKSLGSWMEMYPDYWLEGNYLRYIGWVLSDDSKDVRKESVEALLSLYTKDDHIASMQHFTERFKTQLVRMATSEIDLPVRISCIHVLQSINLHGLLESEQRDEIAKLIFEEEKRVRLAVAPFFDRILEEEVEERTTEMEASIVSPKKGKKADLEARVEQLRLKCLAELLVKYSKQTDGEEDEERDETEAMMLNEVTGNHRGRLALAVDALWEGVPAIRDWEKMMEFLLLDHSDLPEAEEHSTPNGKVNGRKGKNKKAGKDSESESVGAMCELLENEETLLVEVLVASLAKASKSVSSATTKKEKSKDDAELSQISRSVMRDLPKLFAKHQTIPARMTNILTIPCLIKLDHYLDMQQTTTYEALWDDVTKQFLKYTEAEVIDQAVKTIQFFLASSVLANANGEKISELEDTLIASLRQSVDGKDVETAAFDEDELATIGAWVTRISKLFSIRDISTSLDDTEDGKASSAWEIIDSIAERGRLGYKEEGIMVERALGIISLHLQWRIQRCLSDVDGVLEEEELVVIQEKRDSLLSKLEDLAVGTTSNAVEGVKQAALLQLLGIYTTFASITSSTRDPQGRLASLKTICNDQLQARCAGFIEAEIERYGEAIEALQLVPGEEEEEEEEEEGEASGTESDGAKSKKKKKQPKKKPKKSTKKVVTTIGVQNAKKLALLLTSEHFGRTISPFVQAIHAEVIDLRHASGILSNCGRFGSFFDQLVKLLASDLKDEGIYGGQGESVARIIFEAFRDASDHFLTSANSNEEIMNSVSKVLGSSTIVRGAQLAIVNRLPAHDHTRIHIDCVGFIVDKIISYEEGNQKDQKAKAIFLFKPLVNLILGLDGKGALKIKNALDLALSDVEIPKSSRQWEPLRAYQKRLITLISKDPALKAALAKAQEKEVLSDVEEDELEGTAPTQKVKPKAKRAKAAVKVVAAGTGSEEESEMLPPRIKKRVSNTKSYGGSNKKQKVAEEKSDNEQEDEVEEVVEKEVSVAPEESEGEEEVAVPTPRSPTKKRAATSSPTKQAQPSSTSKRSHAQVEESEEEAEVEEEEEEPSSQNSSMSISDFKRRKARR